MLSCAQSLYPDTRHRGEFHIAGRALILRTRLASWGLIGCGLLSALSYVLYWFEIKPWDYVTLPAAIAGCVAGGRYFWARGRAARRIARDYLTVGLLAASAAGALLAVHSHRLNIFGRLLFALVSAVSLGVALQLRWEWWRHDRTSPG